MNKSITQNYFVLRLKCTKCAYSVGFFGKLLLDFDDTCHLYALLSVMIKTDRKIKPILFSWLLWKILLDTMTM